MCPLRYVILGVSILLGIVLYVWSVFSGDEEGGDVDARLTADGEESEGEETCKKCDGEVQSCDCAPFETRATDYVTGRYIYNLWKQASARNETFKAAAILGSVSAAFIGTCVGTIYYFL